MKSIIPTDLIDAIFHPKRLEILLATSIIPESFTNLTNKLDISSSEASRHLSILVEHKLLQKSEISKKYEISSFGKTITSLFQPFSLILKNASFFQTHTLESIPPHLLFSIHTLENVEKVSGIGEVMQRFSTLFELVQEKISLMTPQAFPWGKEDLRVKYLVPQSMMKYRDQAKLNLTSEIRLLENIPVSILITDIAGACVFFSDEEGKVDFNEGFFIDAANTQAMAFVTDLWNHFWKSATLPDFNHD